MASKEEYVKILDLENEFEAGIIRSELDKRNIPFVIESFSDISFNGVYQFQHGWGVLKAPEEYSQEILEIHKDLSENEE